MRLRSVCQRHGILAFAAALLSFCCAGRAEAQGGEPRSFAIRGAKVVPVSGAPMENATVLVSRGVITAVGTNVTIPPDAWVIEGKGLIVYPGLVDAFTDVGLTAPVSGGGNAGGEGNARPPISKGPEDRPATTPWRNAADEINLADSRIEGWRSAGFTTTVSAPKTGMFPGQAAVLDLAGDRPRNLVVKAPVAIPVSLQAPGGFRSYPGSLMGAIAYVRQIWIDTSWSAQADANYEKNPRGVERPRYDESTESLKEALQKHAVVLVPGNSSLEIRRALVLGEEWKLNSVIYGGQMGYEVAAEIAAKKVPVLVDLKWPEAPKDGDPEDVPSLRTLRFRDRAPVFTGSAGKGGSEVRVLFRRHCNPQGHFARGKKVDGCGFKFRRSIARADAITRGNIWRGGRAGLHREGQDREPGGDRRRPVRQKNKSENGVRGRPEV